MTIKQYLPFDVCNKCPEFILDVSEQVLFHGLAGTERVLTVRCKNAGKCKQLKKNLELHGGQENEDR